MSNFRPIDRDTGFLLPPSVDEWLPERHLARFVVEVIGVAMGREAHHPSLEERFAGPPPSPPKDPTPLAAMDHHLKTPEGKKLYALRKQTPEPVFGIIKSVLGFRQFLLRGIDNVRGEWNLVTMAWNMKRMFVLAGAN